MRQSPTQVQQFFHRCVSRGPVNTKPLACLYMGVYTCEQHQGLLCDESVWLSEELVSLQGMNLKG